MSQDPLEQSQRDLLKRNAFAESQHIRAYITSKRPAEYYADVEDAIADALSIWCDHLDQGKLRSPEFVKSWLATTSLRLIDERKVRGGKTVRLASLSNEPALIDDEIIGVLRRIDLSALYEAARLSAAEIELVTLKGALGMNWSEVQTSTSFGQSLPSLRQRYHRVLERLHATVAREAPLSSGTR